MPAAGICNGGHDFGTCPMRLSDNIVVSKTGVAGYGFFRNLFLAS